MSQIPQNVLDEINRHDVSAFKTLGIDHGGVTNAVAFMLNNAMPEMAQHLRQMSQAGFIRQGPLEGFVAAAVTLPDGEYILLSMVYPEFNTNAETMASLVQEVGFLKVFNRALEENELRGQKALQWLSQQKPIIDVPSFISSAAMKQNIKSNEVKKENNL